MSEAPQGAAQTRVCMLLYDPFELEYRVQNEARTLVDAGFEVSVIAIQRPGAVAESDEGGVHVHRIDDTPLVTKLARRVLGRRVEDAALPAAPETGSRSGLHGLLRLGWRVSLVLAYMGWAARAVWDARRRRADVYFAHDLVTLPLAVLARPRGAKLVYDAHELWTEQDLNPPMSAAARRRWGWIERRLIGRADAVTTVSESLAGELARRYEIDPPAVILNASSAPPPSPGARERRAELGLPEGVKLVMFVGNVQSMRPLDTLIEAAAELDDSYAIVVMGSPEPGYVESLRALARRLGVEQRVFFVPPVPQADVVERTALADVGVIPYGPTCLNTFYSLPGKLFQYVTAGVPVVASRLPDIERVVSEFGLGETFDGGEPSDLARAIRAVADEATAHERFAANVRSARDELGWDAQGRALTELVRGLRPLSG